jgi:hypothetical protein
MSSRLARAGFGWGMVMAPIAVAAFVAAAIDAGLSQPRNLGLLLVASAWVGGGAAAVVARAALPLLRRSLHQDSLRLAAFVSPAIAIAAVGPITLHAAVMGPLALMGENVDGWLSFAYGGTVHVHIVFAITLTAAALRLALGGDTKPPLVWPAVVVSLFPGVIILFPPALVALCGVIVSRLFWALARGWQAAELAEDERA